MNIDITRPGVGTPLDLRFKGDRDYLHGTDMVDAVIGQFDGMSDIAVRIQKIADRPVETVVLPDSSNERKNMVAVFSGRLGDKNISIGLREIEGAASPGRYPYDDRDVVTDAVFDFENQTAEMTWNTNYTPIEQIVALQKALLLGCFADAAVHWYFTRLDVSVLPDRFDKLVLSVTQALGTNLVRSGISLNDNDIGNVYFSGVKQ